MHVIITLGLTCFSFYYTEKVVDFVSMQDPIMKEILKNKDNFEIDAIDAYIDDDNIIPGVNGTVVDSKESFKKMKKYGKYNESLYVFNDKEPSISIKNRYDKYIVSASKEKKKVALIFTIDRATNPEDILSILDSEDVLATFFIDGLWLENNISYVKKIIEEGHQVEILSYNGSYDEFYFSNSLSTLNSLTDTNTKYCYSSYKNRQFLDLCSKLSLYTIIPSIETNDSSYAIIKSKIENGSLISLTNSSKELKMSINYIKQKGYEILVLDKILEE